jgi:Ca2+-binding RTX toxin-like protein
MTTLNFRGDQLGLALQFDPGGTTTAVEIGATWFRSTDVVSISFAANSFDPVSGELIGGAGSVIGLTVTSDTGLVTSFGVSASNPLDIDPDGSKNGAGFFYISASPQPGVGGLYGGLQLEKIVVSALPLTAGSSPLFDNTTGFRPDGGGIVTPGPAPEPPPVQPDPTPADITLSVAGNQIGEALQFDPSGLGTTVEIGRTWFSATDTVAITFVPGSFNPVTGELVGGAGAVSGLTVTTALGDVTSFNVSAANPLDVDPDASKNGLGFFYISASPAAGIGGAYAGVQLEKIVVAGVPLTGGTAPIFDNVGGFRPGQGGGVITPPPPPVEPPPVEPPVQPPVPGAVLTFSGSQVAEALQFATAGTTTDVQIGRTWFAASDVVTLTFAPGSFDAATGELVGGPGTVTGLTVTTADGRETNFGVSAADPLDVDPDQNKNGAGFFYIAETPSVGVGGAYDGLQIEKIVVTKVALATGTRPVFDNQTGFVPETLGISAGVSASQVLPGNPITGSVRPDTLTGTPRADAIQGMAGVDRLIGGAGNDVLVGGSGADVLIGGMGADRFVFGARDTVKDFKQAQGDRILVDAIDGVIVSHTRRGVLLSLSGESGSMLLEGVGPRAFNPAVALVYDSQPF